MTTLVKLTLMHRMGLYEEQLYELCMYLRNDKENVVQHIIEQGNNQDTINRKTLNAYEIVDSIVKALQGYVSIVDYSFNSYSLTILLYFCRNQSDLINDQRLTFISSRNILILKRKRFFVI